MARIADFGSNTTLIRYMLKTQQSVLQDTYRLASGKISEQYSGIKRGAQRLVNLENLQSMNSRYMLNNEVMKLRVSVSEDAVTGVKDTLKSFRTELMSLQSRGIYDDVNVDKIQKWAFTALQDMESYLNTQVDGFQLFGGSRTTTDAVDLGLSSLSSFQEKYDGSFRTYPTTRDQHLASFSYSEDTQHQDTIHIDNSNWLTFRKDDDGDTTTTGVSTIEAASSMFSDYKVGNLISVTGTTSNNGDYTIASISSDGTKITVNTEMFTDETHLETVTTEAASSTVVFTPESGTALLNATTGDVSFDTTTRIATAVNATAFDSFSVGQTIEISGTASNNGVFTVSAISADGKDLTLGDPPLTVELPDGTELGAAELGKTIFSRSGDTLTSNINNTFDALSAGDTIVIDSSLRNDATYTVKSIGDNGTKITIESSNLTDEGLTTGNSFFSHTGSTKTVFDATAKTISAQSSAGAALANAYLNTKVGDTVTVAGTDFDYSSNTKIAFTANGGAPNGTIQVQDSTGAAYTGVFADLNVGDTVTIAGSTNNNASFTVNYVSEDGSTITVDEAVTTEADTDGTALTGDVTFTAATQLVFAAPSTLEIQPNGGGAAIAGSVPAGLIAGATFTIAGGANAGTYTVATNDGTTITTVETTIANETAAGDVTMHADMNDASYTVSAISSDKSTLTVEEDLRDQTDSDGTTVSVATRNISATTGTKLVFDATNDRIKAVLKQDGSSVTGVFSDLRAAQTLTVANSQSNNATLTIDSVAADGSYVDVTDDITVNETDAAASLSVYAAAGTVAISNNYYKGDDRTMEHRVDRSRTMNMNLKASDPAFEKAIRALSIIAQGKFGTEGGLDNNQSRVDDALYLLYGALYGPTPGDPPYGEELNGDIESLQFDLSFKQITIRNMIETHQQTNVIYEGWINNSEDADPLETITRLQSEQLSLETSYQAVNQIFSMSLINFLK